MGSHELLSWHPVDETQSDENYAADVIRFICGIESRSELKTNEEARIV